MQSVTHSSNFTLPAIMTAATAESVTLELTKLPLVQKTHLQIDISKVEDFATAGAQTLVALNQSLKAVEGTLELTGNNLLVQQILNEIGLSWLMNPLR